MLKAEGVQPCKARKMMERLGKSDGEKGENDVCYKRTAKLIGSFEKAADKDRVEKPEEEESQTESEKIRVHQRVCPIDRRPGKKRHSQQNDDRHKQQRGKLDEADKEIFSLYHILFRYGQQGGKQDIICLSCVLKTLKNSESYEKYAAEHRISGQEKHKSEKNKQKRQNMGAQPDFFQQYITHFLHPFQAAEKFLPDSRRLLKNGG